MRSQPCRSPGGRTRSAPCLVSKYWRSETQIEWAWTAGKGIPPPPPPSGMGIFCWKRAGGGRRGQAKADHVPAGLCSPLCSLQDLSRPRQIHQDAMEEEGKLWGGKLPELLKVPSIIPSPKTRPEAASRAAGTPNTAHSQNASSRNSLERVCVVLPLFSGKLELGLKAGEKTLELGDNDRVLLFIRCPIFGLAISGAAPRAGSGGKSGWMR